MTATSLPFNAELTRGSVMPRGRLLRAYLTEAKYEFVRMLRTPAFAVPFLGLPVMLYLLFGVVIFGAAVRLDPAAGPFLFAAFSVFGMMGPGMFGFGMAAAIEREQGLLRFKRALPMPPASYLVAKMIMAMLFGAIIMVTMLVAALTLAHLKLGLGQCVLVSMVTILGGMPFCSIGLFIGALTSGKSAPAYLNVVYQIMMHLSGLFYPLPKVLLTIAPVWPTYHLQQLVMSVLGSHAVGGSMTHVAVLIGVTLLFGVFAMRRLARVG
jgi:ABC-2 type transport system permease protein